MVSVMLYSCMLCVTLLMDMFPLCVACLTVFDSVCELFGKTIRNMFGCGCYFVVECYGNVYCGWGCYVEWTVYGLPKNVRVVPVILVCI